jgi:hypothetical protein
VGHSIEDSGFGNFGRRALAAVRTPPAPSKVPRFISVLPMSTAINRVAGEASIRARLELRRVPAARAARSHARFIVPARITAKKGKRSATVDGDPHEKSAK